MPRTNFNDPILADRVRQLYETGKTQLEVGLELGIGQSAVWHIMRRHGIVSRRPVRRTVADAAEHIRGTVGLVSGNRRCPDCGGNKDPEANFCQLCMPPVRGLLGKTGEQHPCWKGAPPTVDKDGYIRVHAPDHPWPRRRGYIRENIRVMELAIGRRITNDEVVHHIDHDRCNNALENLQLMRRGEHSRYHRMLDLENRKRDSGGRFT